MTKKRARPRGVKAAPETRALPVIESLCAALAESGVRYCHFKSNDMLAKTETGENDLDLLVHRADAGRFISVLTAQGYKEADGPYARRIPTVTHYYGLDPSGKLVNVHAHFSLVAGDDTTKNVRVPFEDAYIASSSMRGIFPVPSPDFELVLFVIRMVLKHGAPDVIPFGKAKLGGAERRELETLLTWTDPEAAAAVVERHLPFLGRALWMECFRSLAPGKGAARVRAFMRLQRAMDPFSRRGFTADTSRKLTRRTMWGAKRFVLKRKTRKMLSTGGAVVSFVGGDGAGKSTAIEGTEAWLKQTFETRRVHLGKPPKSWTTIAVKGSLLVLVKAGRMPSLKTDARGAAGDERDDLGVAWALWHLMTARDRYHTFMRARRFANRGGIVITDRFPLPWVRLMDGARASRLAAQPGASRLVRAIGRLERRYYDRMALPDVLIVLRLDPEVAVARKAGVDEPGYVRARNEEIYTLSWEDTPALVIDAERPADEVLATIRSLVWERL